MDKISSSEKYPTNMKMDGKAFHGALSIEVLLKKWFPIVKELKLFITKANVMEDNDDEGGEIEIMTRQIPIPIPTNPIKNWGFEQTQFSIWEYIYINEEVMQRFEGPKNKRGGVAILFYHQKQQGRI